ncbi:hypothetical protein CIB48_g1383 [Xylaria polymorpha]|nr:hypothetical protein CIB48_g1383 [Xylaria polymorpha]
MPATRPVQAFDTSTLDTNSRARARAVLPDDAMKQTRSALSAEIAVHRIPLIRVACVLLYLGRQLGREREQAVGREDGRRPKCRAGLPSALGAVTMVHNQRCRRWCRKCHAPALAADREGL